MFSFTHRSFLTLRYTTFSVLLGAFSHLSHLLIPVFSCTSPLTFHFLRGLYPEIHSPTPTVYSLTFPYTYMMGLRLLQGKQVDQKTSWLKWTPMDTDPYFRQYQKFWQFYNCSYVFKYFYNFS